MPIDIDSACAAAFDRLYVVPFMASHDYIRRLPAAAAAAPQARAALATMAQLRMSPAVSLSVHHAATEGGVRVVPTGTAVVLHSGQLDVFLYPFSTADVATFLYPEQVCQA